MQEFQGFGVRWALDLLEFGFWLTWVRVGEGQGVAKKLHFGEGDIHEEYGSEDSRGGQTSEFADLEMQEHSGVLFRRHE